MSKSIWMDNNKFKKFINNLSKNTDLKRVPKDKSAFPLDFKVIYKEKFILISFGQA